MAPPGLTAESDAEGATDSEDIPCAMTATRRDGGGPSTRRAPSRGPSPAGRRWWWCETIRPTGRRLLLLTVLSGRGGRCRRGHPGRRSWLDSRRRGVPSPASPPGGDEDHPGDPRQGRRALLFARHPRRDRPRARRSYRTWPRALPASRCAGGGDPAAELRSPGLPGELVAARLRVGATSISRGTPSSSAGAARRSR